MEYRKDEKLLALDFYRIISKRPSKLQFSRVTRLIAKIHHRLSLARPSRPRNGKEGGVPKSSNSHAPIVSGE